MLYLETFPIEYAFAHPLAVNNTSLVPFLLIPHIVPMIEHQIIIAVLVFHDQVTWFNILGLGWAITGSILYKVARAKPNTCTGEENAGKDER